MENCQQIFDVRLIKFGPRSASKLWNAIASRNVPPRVICQPYETIKSMHETGESFSVQQANAPAVALGTLRIRTVGENAKGDFQSEHFISNWPSVNVFQPCHDCSVLALKVNASISIKNSSSQMKSTKTRRKLW